MTKNIIEATLLTIDDVKRINTETLMFDKFWWLKTPVKEFYAPGIMYVAKNGTYDDIGTMTTNIRAIRPALVFDDNSETRKYAKLKINDTEFDIVCDGRYALCKTAICDSCFDENKNNTNYETSKIKAVIDEWFKKLMTTLETAEPVWDKNGVYHVPFTYEKNGYLTIIAENANEAIEKAQDEIKIIPESELDKLSKIDVTTKRVNKNTLND